MDEIELDFGAITIDNATYKGEGYKFYEGLLAQCSGQLKLATVLELSQYKRSDSLGVNPPLY